MSVAIFLFIPPNSTDRPGLSINFNAPVVIVQQGEQDVGMVRWGCTANFWLANVSDATILANSTATSQKIELYECGLWITSNRIDAVVLPV
jgi:hypothetical protein